MFIFKIERFIYFCSLCNLKFKFNENTNNNWSPEQIISCCIERVYASFNDSAEMIYSHVPSLSPALFELCHPAKTILKHCCLNILTANQIGEQYSLFIQVNSLDENSSSRNSFFESISF